MSHLLKIKYLGGLIFSTRSVRDAVIAGALTTLFFLRMAVSEPASGILLLLQAQIILLLYVLLDIVFLLLLQAQIILLLYVLLDIVFLCWVDMVDAYKRSRSYRTVLPRGNAFHRAVHALLQEAVCGSKLTAFLADFIPWSMLVGLPALVAWWFGFASLGMLLLFSILAWLLARLVYVALCDIFGWKHERELLLFRTVNLDGDR